MPITVITRASKGQPLTFEDLDLNFTVLSNAINAQAYVLPTATDTVLGGVKVGPGLAINAGVVSVVLGSGGACAFDDARLSDARTPTAHNHSAEAWFSGHTHTPASLGAATSVHDHSADTWFTGHTHTPASLGAATSTHNHDSAYLGIAAKATDSSKLDGTTPTTFGKSLVAVADAAGGRSTLGAAASTHSHNAADVEARVAVADAAYTVTGTGSRIVAYTSLTAARVVTLPAATTPGQKITLLDESGSCNPTKTLALQRAGSDTIEGATTVVLNSSNMGITVVSSGGGKWTCLPCEEVRLPVADAAYTVATLRDVIVAYTSLTAARIVTLPAATAAGQRVTLLDESGSASATITLTLTRAGSDTINGATTAVVNSAYGSLSVVSNGGGKWTIQQSAASGGGAAAPQAQSVTASGNVTVPTGMTKALATLVGGGGGGATTSGVEYCGQGGRVVTRLLTVTPGASMAITVGAGGTTGNGGGTTTFGGVSAHGGMPGTSELGTYGSTTVYASPGLASGSGHTSGGETAALLWRSSWLSTDDTSGAPVANSGQGGGSNSTTGAAGRVEILWMP